jgi:hypothetical protein
MPTWRWSGQVLADVILPDQFAETVAEIQTPEDSNIRTDVRPNYWFRREPVLIVFGQIYKPSQSASSLLSFPCASITVSRRHGRCAVLPCS